MSERQKSVLNVTGLARPWSDDEIIVSKTDLKGHITYANDVFRRVSLMEEADLIGKPHNVIRHPEMPRCIFKLLWDRIQAGHEIFAYVNNRAKNGDHYWVLAHITPNLSLTGTVTGYSSFRRKPSEAQIGVVSDLYASLLLEERKHVSPKQGLTSSSELLMKTLQEKGTSYEEFIFSF